MPKRRPAPKNKKKYMKEKIYRVPECKCGSYNCKKCNPSGDGATNWGEFGICND